MNGAINGIVLAGGLSSRMGRDKALLPWKGRTLLEHMRGLLLQAGAGRVWVSGDYPAFGGIPDQVARCGPGWTAQRDAADARQPGLGGSGGYAVAGATAAATAGCRGAGRMHDL
ncbi:NTP transferase domain-containing protein [Stenotrophomonas sp. CD2]|nr:NTP transferase domain-containing protein [Stenotrophomonas sp. CD2]